MNCPLCETTELGEEGYCDTCGETYELIEEDDGSEGLEAAEEEDSEEEELEDEDLED